MKRAEPTQKHQHLTVRLEERLIEVLQRRAVENDRSVSAELRQILRDAFRAEMGSRAA